MTTDQIAESLNVSPSGGRKYSQDLLRAGVIEISHTIRGGASHIEKSVYKVSDDAERVKNFMRMLSERDGGYMQKSQRSEALRRNPEIPGAHLHTLADDTYFQVRRAPKTIPQRDPLVAALFGAAPQK